MNKIRRFRKNRKATEQKINKAKSAVLKLSLIMLNFIFATFAWFTYTMILNPAVDVNVSAWQVDFKDNDGTLGNAMQLKIENFYPGMEDYTKEIKIENLGDRPAGIGYKIDTLTILGEDYTVEEPVVEEPQVDEAQVVAEDTETGTEETNPEDGATSGEETPGEEEPTEEARKVVYKSETIDEAAGIKTIKLLNDSTQFPFEIIITHSIQIGIEDPYDETKNKGSFKIRFTWPYEITDEDATQTEIEAKNTLDTKWGHDIVNFYETREEGDNTQGIEITLKAIVEQII